MSRPIWKPLILVLLLATAFACRRAPEDGHEPGRDHRRERPGGPGRYQGPAPALAPGAEEACEGVDSLTILMDGAECADPAYHAARSQPAVIVRLTEAPDETALLLIDVGVDSRAMENNLRQWFRGQGLGSLSVHKAIVFSHAHTFAGLFAPPWRYEEGPVGSLSHAWEIFGDVPVQGPNLADLCDDRVMIMGHPVARKLCSTFRTSEPGLAPVRFSDGTLSRRAWTLTYPIAPEELAEIPFQPAESMFIFRSGDGYSVYSVCSHRRHGGSGDHSSQPIHAVDLVRERIDAGDLPPGPVHTLVTGTCGMRRRLPDRSKDKSLPPEQQQQQLVSELSELAERVGIERVYLNHCGLMNEELWPAFMEVFGEQVRRAVPGSCIPL